MRPGRSPQPRRWLAAGALCLAMIGAVADVGGASSAVVVHPQILSFTSISGYRTNITRRTNQQRSAAGARPLYTSAALTNACQAHANDMAARRTLSHTGSDGSTSGTRARRYGFPWTSLGENIAYGQTSSAAVVGAWMASSGHRANILNRTFTHMGIGIQQASNGQLYFCMLLASA